MTVTEKYSETEERIFNAALTVFSQKGKDGARMQEIADEAGINKAMLHYYFRSKNKLYESVFEYVFFGFLVGLNEALAEAGSFKETLRRFIDTYMDTHVKRPEIMRLMLHENLAGAQAIRAAKESMGDEFACHAPFRPFIQRMNAAIAAGEIRAVDPFHTFVTILGASVFFFLSLPTFSIINPAFAGDLDAVVQARKEHLFDLIYNGLRRGE
jgi:TetR/AcrR family transcriptional regulator